MAPQPWVSNGEARRSPRSVRCPWLSVPRPFWWGTASGAQHGRDLPRGRPSGGGLRVAERMRASSRCDAAVARLP